MHPRNQVQHCTEENCQHHFVPEIEREKINAFRSQVGEDNTYINDNQEVAAYFRMQKHEDKHLLLKKIRTPHPLTDPYPSTAFENLQKKKKKEEKKRSNTYRIHAIVRRIMISCICCFRIAIIHIVPCIHRRKINMIEKKIHP